jgi:hypothetical protein
MELKLPPQSEPNGYCFDTYAILLDPIDDNRGGKGRQEAERGG